MKLRPEIAETEIETGFGLKPRRIQERFLKGPILIRNIASASKLPGKSLGLYLALHHQTALTGKQCVTLPKALLSQLGISRDAKARALKQLHEAGLVRVENRRGRAARVELHDTVAQKPASDRQWAVTDVGLQCANPYYPISKSQLSELRERDTGVAMWPLQMAEKSWVDIEDFIAAFEEALRVHRPDGADLIDRPTSYALAREKAEQIKENAG